MKQKQITIVRENAKQVVQDYFSVDNFDVSENVLQDFINNIKIKINEDDSEVGYEVIFECDIKNIKVGNIEIMQDILRPHQGNLKCHIVERLHDIYQITLDF